MEVKVREAMLTGGAPNLNPNPNPKVSMANHAAAAGDRHVSGRLVRMVRVRARDEG